MACGPARNHPSPGHRDIPLRTLSLHPFAVARRPGGGARATSMGADPPQLTHLETIRNRRRVRAFADSRMGVRPRLCLFEWCFAVAAQPDPSPWLGQVGSTCVRTPLFQLQVQPTRAISSSS